MAKDLTTSAIDRQNILNNPMAIPKIREALDVSFVEYKGTFYVTKQMAAKFYEVDERTVTNCLNANDEELRRNGYKLLQGEELKEFKQCFGQEMDFPTKTTILGVFDFRSFKTAQLVDNLIQLAPSWKRDYEICNTRFTGCLLLFYHTSYTLKNCQS